MHYQLRANCDAPLLPPSRSDHGPMRPKPSTNSIALAGEFAVLSQLALRGFDANLTLGNTKGVDILVSDPRSDAMHRVEVKTTLVRNKKGSSAQRSSLFGHCYQWRMSEKHEAMTDERLFYCFVNTEGIDRIAFQFFIVPSETVAAYVRDQHQVWLKHSPMAKNTQMRVFRLALEPNEVSLEAPLAGRYLDNWGFDNPLR